LNQFALTMRDRDNDGLMDLQEKRLVTNIINPDTDGDGIADNRDIQPRTVNRQSELELTL